MGFSFTGIVYFPIAFAVMFVSYRFYNDWTETGKTEEKILFLTFLFFGIVSFCGAFAGTIFAQNSSGIKWMLILSSFFLTFANSLLVYLSIFNYFKKISPYWGFWFVFSTGLLLTIITIFSPIHPYLEKTGGISWGMPVYINIWRFLIYFFGVGPLTVLYYRRFISENDSVKKNEALFLMLIFALILLTVFVDFIVEPLTGIQALFSEVVLLFLSIVGMLLYFYLNEKEVTAKEKRFKRLVENMSDMISLIDKNGIIRYANSACEKYLGYASDELIGKSIYDFIDLEDHPLVKKNLHFTHRNSVHDSFEFKMFHADGSIFWVETFGSFLLDEKSELERIVVASRDITERKSAHQLLEQNLKEKEILLKEIHHRVKNNLNIISSLLRLQARNIMNIRQAKDALKESEKRVFSMALVHKKLYDSDNFSFIEMKSYINSLAKELLFSFNELGKVEYSIEAENIFLDLNTAIPCGIILNELITNSIKYAFPEINNAKIIISFKRNENIYYLVFQDNGVGISSEISLETVNSMGLRLIYLLVKQLNGSVKIEVENGTKFSIEFPAGIEMSKF